MSNQIGTNGTSCSIKCPCCLSDNDVLFLCNAGKNGKYTQYQCYKCGFQFTNPCPTESELDEFYATEEYYSQEQSDEAGCYTDYDQQTEWALNIFREWLKENPLPEKASVLDIGCAKGRFMEIAMKEFGYRCSGVELSDYARDYVKEFYNDVFPVWKTLDDVRSPEGGFDLILFLDVVEHVNDPWSFFLQIFQKGCVGPHTKILISTPNCFYGDAVKDPGAWCYRYPPAHLSFCSPETFQKIGETLLFRNINISGHSLFQQPQSRVKELLENPYCGYNGLTCCFSNSSLGSITPERFPASLEELKNNQEYLSLLTDFIFEKKNLPANPAFNNYLKDFCQNLTSQNENLTKEYQNISEHCTNLTKAHQDLSNNYTDLEKAYHSISVQHTELNKAHQDLSEHYSVLGKAHQELVTQHGLQSAELEELHKNNYLFWLNSQEIHVQLELQKKQIEQSAEQNTSLHQKLNQALQENNQLEIKVHDYAEQQANLKDQLEHLLPYKDQLETQVRDFSEQNVELHQKLRDMLAERNNFEGLASQLYSDIGQLQAQVGQLCSDKGQLEAQVGQLCSDKGQLEAQVGQLCSDKGQLEAQIGQLCSDKGQLEASVSYLSAKLNETYLSNSYKIGRMITFPIRKCKSLAIFIHNKLTKSADVK